ncbi:MAG: DUF1097 family protein [Clostridiales bacterium]|nr:DUF1097 family protein [Clostridiales bacterium]
MPILKKALAVAIVAALLCTADKLIAPIFAPAASFMWIAFISWTVFFSSTNKERVQAIIGNIIGFFAACAIVYLGSLFQTITPATPWIIAICGIIATGLINFGVMFFELAQKYWLGSISGIFVGIAITFSGAGVGIPVYNLTLLAIIFVYGILGHLSAWLTTKLSGMFIRG